MGNDWNVIKLEDACSKIGSGITPKGGNSVYKESGIPLIRSQNIYNNYFQYSGIAFIEESVANKMKNVELQEDDVLINITGDSVARCTIVPKDMIGGRINQHVSIIRTDKSKLDPYFLKYYLVSDNMQRMLLSIAKEGATRAALTKKMIENIQIKVPNIDTQRKISSILNSFTNKIELNNEMNKTLEEMAQAIFKSWFVDFEPFKDGEFEESELGIIPKGWKVVKLGEIGDVKGGKRLPKGSKLEDIKTEHPYLRVTDVTNGYVDLAQIKYIADEVSDSVSRYIINKEDIYISIAGTIGVCGIIPKSISGANLTENMARIIPNDNNYRNYILLYLNSKNGKSVIKSRTVGSTQPKLPLYGIKDVPILYNEDVIKKFNKAVDGILERIQHNLEQNNELKNIRDTLLSKLISGEIKL